MTRYLFPVVLLGVGSWLSWPELVTAGKPVHVEAAFEHRALKTVSGKPFEKRAGKTRVLPVTAGGVFIHSAPVLGGHAVIGTAASHWALPIEWRWVDLASGKQGEKLKTVWDGSAATGTVVVSTGEGDHARPALLHLADGKLVEAQPTLPNGVKATQVRVVVDQQKPVTWIFARKDDGQTYSGEWKNTSSGGVDLSENIGFWPTHVSGQNGIQAWRELPNGATGACDRVVAESGWPVRCRPAPGTDAAPFDLVSDCIRYDGQQLVDDCAQSSSQLTCGGTLRTVLLSPERALMACITPNHPPRLSLWSQKKTWSSDDPTSTAWKSSRTQRGRRSVIGLELLADAKAQVKRWLDVEHGVIWDGPPLRPVTLSEQRDDHRRLVQAPGKPKELWLLDLDAGTLELVASDLDCDAPVYEYARNGDRAVLSCLPKASEAAVYNDEKRLRAWTWTEVVDLKSRKRWRSTEVFEPKIGDDGIVVGTKRGKTAQLAVIETP